MTNRLGAWQQGDSKAGEEAVAQLYDELRTIAAKVLSGERRDHTLETSALVHEAYFRLANQDKNEWRSRVHFLSVAARMMRRILVDHARTKNAQRRGGLAVTVSLDDLSDDLPDSDSLTVDILALHKAMELLEEHDAALARLVELRFFGGLENTEIAAVLGVCSMTVSRRWRFAQTWLLSVLTSTEPGP